VLERFDDNARRVLVLAQEEARHLRHGFIGTEHLVCGLVRQGGTAAEVLGSFGVSLETLRRRIAETIGPAQSAPTASPSFTPRSKKVLELAGRESTRLGEGPVGPEHILLGLLRERGGAGVQVLVGLGVDPARVRLELVRLLTEDDGAGVTEQWEVRGESGGRARVTESRLPLFLEVLGQLEEKVDALGARIQRLEDERGNTSD
jgi:ATP-dependent Clp protease ATP-binding subunit ClpC